MHQEHLKCDLMTACNAPYLLVGADAVIHRGVIAFLGILQKERADDAADAHPLRMCAFTMELPPQATHARRLLHVLWSAFHV